MTIYFVRRVGTLGPVKIGFTNDLSSRLATLNTATPEKMEVLCTVPGGPELEGYLHSAFSSSRINGEWFELGDDLQRMIDLLGKVGVGALPAGAAGISEGIRREHAGNVTDVELAGLLIRRVLEPVPAGLGIGGQVRLAARRLGWSHGRAKAVWYLEARMIAAHEMRRLHEAANQKWVETHAAAEIGDLRRRVSAIEASHANAAA